MSQGPAIRTGSEAPSPVPANTRELLEHLEADFLAPAAVRSRGAARRLPESESPVRTSFQRDRDRIVHSKSFRRLMHKTQVFIAPKGDHYRTRLTHTLEVTQIARTIGRALSLNEDLIEAIGMGHDLGHTPFGHAGERALAEVFPGFRHNEQSLRIVDSLEKDGKGLNLTEPVRDGILRHSKGRSGIMAAHSSPPNTLEGEVLKISDGLAYINHDLDDAIRAGLIEERQVPRIITERLGTNHASRINTLVMNVIEHSDTTSETGAIRISEYIREAADALRDFLYEQVYTPLNAREDTLRAQHVVREIFAYYVKYPEALPETWLPVHSADSVERRAADFVAAMTDRYAIDLYKQIFVPQHWSV